MRWLGFFVKEIPYIGVHGTSLRRNPTNSFISYFSLRIDFPTLYLHLFRGFECWSTLIPWWGFRRSWSRQIWSLVLTYIPYYTIKEHSTGRLLLCSDITCVIDRQINYTSTLTDVYIYKSIYIYIYVYIQIYVYIYICISIYTYK
jgi:hypothetical protein